jgi:hypothetical protein
MSEIKRFLVTHFSGNNDYAEHLGQLLDEYQGSGLAPPHLVSEITSGCDGKRPRKRGKIVLRTTADVPRGETRALPRF